MKSDRTAVPTIRLLCLDRKEPSVVSDVSLHERLLPSSGETASAAEMLGAISLTHDRLDPL